jgi:hypothetical protein
MQLAAIAGAIIAAAAVFGLFSGAVSSQFEKTDSFPRALHIFLVGGIFLPPVQR